MKFLVPLMTLCSPSNQNKVCLQDLSSKVTKSILPLKNFCLFLDLQIKVKNQLLEVDVAVVVAVVEVVAEEAAVDSEVVEEAVVDLEAVEEAVVDLEVAEEEVVAEEEDVDSEEAVVAIKPSTNVHSNIS